MFAVHRTADPAPPLRSIVEPKHTNDKVPGRTRDELFELNASKVYFELAIKVVKHLKLPCGALDLDGTRIHVDGRYNSDSERDDENLNCIRLYKGYHRDHHPDFNSHERKKTEQAKEAKPQESPVIFRVRSCKKFCVKSINQSSRVKKHPRER